MRAGIDVPLSFDVYLKNRSAEPISIEQVRLESYGMVSYTVRSRTERFRKTVAPGETEKVPLFATARIVSRQAAGAEPLTVRVFITLGTPYGRITRIFMRDAGGTVTGPR
jgi:hypothetical protein